MSTVFFKRTDMFFYLFQKEALVPVNPVTSASLRRFCKTGNQEKYTINAMIASAIRIAIVTRSAEIGALPPTFPV